MAESCHYLGGKSIMGNKMEQYKKTARKIWYIFLAIIFAVLAISACIAFVFFLQIIKFVLIAVFGVSILALIIYKGLS